MEEQEGQAIAAEQLAKGNLTYQDFGEWGGFNDESDESRKRGSDTEDSDADYVSDAAKMPKNGCKYLLPFSLHLSPYLGFKGYSASFSKEARTNHLDGLPYRLQKDGRLGCAFFFFTSCIRAHSGPSSKKRCKLPQHSPMNIPTGVAKTYRIDLLNC